MVEVMALVMVMALYNLVLMAHIMELLALILEQSIHHHKVMEQESIHHHKVIQLWFQQVVEYTLQHVVVVRRFHNSMGIHSIRHLRILLKLIHQLHILIILQLQQRSFIFFDEKQPLLRLWLYLSASIEDSFRAFHFWHWQLHMWPKEQRVLRFSF